MSRPIAVTNSIRGIHVMNSKVARWIARIAGNSSSTRTEQQWQRSRSKQKGFTSISTTPPSSRTEADGRVTEQVRTASNSTLDTVAWELVQMYLYWGPNMEWTLNRLYEQNDLLRKVPSGPDKVLVHARVQTILKGMVLNG
ncbi:hypothetical protein [Nocardia phage P3.1]|nr:hypothetical protein [Nocardia phage P3.1]